VTLGLTTIMNTSQQKYTICSRTFPQRFLSKKKEGKLKELAVVVKKQTDYLKELSKSRNIKIYCANYYGNEVEFEDAAMTVLSYHVGLKSVKVEDSILTYADDVHIYSYNVFLERMLLQSNADRQFLPPHLFKVQADDYDSSRGLDVLMEYIRQGLSSKMEGSDMTECFDWLGDQIDHLCQLMHWYRKCEDFSDFYRLTALGYRLFTGRFMACDLLKKVQKMFEPEVQADTFGDLLQILRSGFTTAQTVTEAPLVRKLVELYSYLLTQGFLVKFGIELNEIEYSKLEMKAMAIKYSSRKELWMSVIDTTLFICEKLYEFKQTGDISVFVHNSSEYSKWLKEADRILALGPFSSNLGPHGTTYFAYISDINDLVERGDAYAKYARTTSGSEGVFLKKKLLSLHLLKNTEITRRASQKERQAPFGVLVHGGSSVGKSTFTKMLYYYYGKLHGLSTDDHFRYVRNPADEYWSNFDSSKWCIQMDDIAFMLPSKASEIDPTLMEMLSVVNNVPFVPPQAALEDKGKTPVMAKLVIATTNAPNLNAHEYFYCPLAVRRRLPFVVNVKPKEQYRHENGRFIKPDALTPIDGAFPDYWEITVQKVVPFLDGDKERATLETIAVFSEVAKFLQFYGEHSRMHDGTQDKSMACDNVMSQLHVCPVCLLVQSQCDCAIEVQSTFEDWSSYACRKVSTGVYNTFVWTVRLDYFLRAQLWLAKWHVIRSVFVRFMLHYQPGDVQMRILGKFNEIASSPRKWKLIISGLAAVATCVAVYYAGSAYTSKKKEDKAKPYVEKADVQGNTFNTTEDDIQKEEKSNVWYNGTMELSRFDVPVPSQSLVGRDSAFLRDMFSPNCVRLEIKSRTDVPFHLGIGAVIVKGQYIMVNNHAFRETVTDYDVEIIQSSVLPGVNSNIKVRVPASQIMRDPERDICIFEVKAIPAQKDILKFWTEESLQTTRLLGVRRTSDGLVEKQDILGVSLLSDFPVEALGTSIKVYLGQGERFTRAGDCGALGIAMTPIGVTIVGIHTLGYTQVCGYMYVPRSAIEALIGLVQAVNGGIVVQGGGKPMLDLNDTEIVLIPAHHKSIFRYVQEGTANIYGTFPGFRPKPRSKVCKTPLHEEMLEHYNVVNEYGAPAMAGWEPWRRNVLDMIVPNVMHDENLLNHCVESFTNDILRELSPGWEKDMMFLSRKAAVNGLPGVIYIDRLNMNSSMGFPWNTTKKRFIISEPDEKYPEGVNFGPEVWDRVARIEEKYEAGIRSYPVFTGHLKDEATPLVKCQMKKTRMFTGGPVDWSIVVRMRLLTFVRLVQKNKFAFEAGPGTVCQSAEWGNVYDYLTHFGKDRMIAGDYGAYDKKMIANFILAAFRIICNVCRVAGYSENELQQIMCIGHDVAFPMVNVNGDLTMFYGSNPSGHPLTVIINSLANSLYVRYAYSMGNPARECVDFKTHVKLFTYGDDNIMGVSPKAWWFTHTTIMNEMAKIGVTYTMADKGAESVPYINIDDCSFLKRKWIWNEDVGAWLCPLEEKSIVKSLTMWLPSKSIDEYCQMVAVISSANSEYFFHGREVFEHHHNYFKEILSREPYSYYVQDSTLPRWDDLLTRFWKASEDAPVVERALAGPSM
jgi:hypothetical protein